MTIAVPRMIGVVGVRGQLNAGGRKAGDSPAGCRQLLVCDVGRGWRVQDVNALVLRICAIMNMPVDVSLHV